MSLTDDAWRSALHTAYDVFAPLFKQDITLSLPYGILSGAILWSVRDAEEAPIQRAWLETACDPEHLSLLLKSVRGWDILDPLGAARAINKRATDNPALRAALDTVLAYCREDMLTYSMIKQITDSAASISVGGDVSGGNVNIGGYQYIVGDLIIQYITPKAERMCPTPPAPPLYFGGRDAVLNTLKDKIKAGESIALTAINGVGGVGKTTLARALAHQMHTEKVFRAVLWADVTRAPDALSILRGWALSYADSSFSTENMKPDQIAAAVKGLLDDVINKRCEICEPSRVLVVLDDVWDSGLEAARLIQTACPDNATMLITTRSENLAHNMQALVEPLGYLSPEDAAALLAKYLPDTDVTPLRELGKALGGHALALELAARRIKKEAGRDTLDNALRRCLTDYQRGIPAGSTLGALKLEQGEKREDNLTVALALSYQDLSDADQRRFRALGVLAFDAPFDQTILAALWDTPPERVDDLADTLRLLSLIQADIGGYRQHPLLRSYALALLKQADELENTFARYADQVILIAEKFYELPLEQWVQLTPYLPHIYAAGNELVVRTSNVAAVPEIVLKRAQLFALNTSYYLANRREVRQIDWTEMGLAVSRQLEDAPREARFLNDLGVGYSALGDNARALDYFEQALPLRRAVGDRRGEASTLSNIGAVYSDLGDNARALDYFEQALPLRRAVGDRRGEAVTCFNIGMAYQNLGDLDKAIEYVSRCVELDRQVQHPDLENDQRVLEQLKRQRNGAELASQTLSEEIIKALADNTVAVKTSVPDSLNKWHTQLQAFRDEAASKGASWQVEVAFADALIAVLDDQPAALPDNNPYQPYLNQVLSAIDDFKKGTNS